MIPAFNAEPVMNGQGTCGLEIVEQCPELNAVVIPVSGGGLISGVSTAIKAVAPQMKVVGAEPAALPRYSESLKAGKPVKVEQKKSIADALVAQMPGDICYPYVAENTDTMVAYLVCCNGTPAGLLLGEAKEDGALNVLLDYSVPSYRDCSVGAYLYANLGAHGIQKLVFSQDLAAAHSSYLTKMGFENADGNYTKTIG